MEYYAEGDIVFHEGESGNVMYFVVKGHLEERHYISDPAPFDGEVKKIARGSSLTVPYEIINTRRASESAYLA